MGEAFESAQHRGGIPGNVFLVGLMGAGKTSVGRARLKSVPAKVTRAAGQHRIVGAAWGAPIARVEVQVDGGPWVPATLDRSEEAYFAWRLWSLDWGAPAVGEHTVTSRAIDTQGQIQPAPGDPWIAQKQTYLESTGQVTRRQVQPGDSVTADQRILLEVVDPSALHVEFAVMESELPRLRVGLPVWVEVPSLTNGRLSGRIESLGAAPRGTAPGHVGRIRLARLPRQARAGMLANVHLKPGK